jgi:hypothetical protein
MACVGMTQAFRMLGDPRCYYVELPRHRPDPPAYKYVFRNKLRAAYLRHLAKHNPESFNLKEFDSPKRRYVALHHFHPTVVRDFYENPLTAAQKHRVPVSITEHEMKQFNIECRDEDRILSMTGKPTGGYYFVPDYPQEDAHNDLKALIKAERHARDFMSKLHQVARERRDAKVTSPKSLVATPASATIDNVLPPEASSSVSVSGSSVVPSNIDIPLTSWQQQQRQEPQKPTEEPTPTAPSSAATSAAGAEREDLYYSSSHDVEEHDIYKSHDDSGLGASGPMNEDLIVDVTDDVDASFEDIWNESNTSESRSNLLAKINIKKNESSTFTSVQVDPPVEMEDHEVVLEEPLVRAMVSSTDISSEDSTKEEFLEKATLGGEILVDNNDQAATIPEESDENSAPPADETTTRRRRTAKTKTDHALVHSRTRAHAWSPSFSKDEDSDGEEISIADADEYADKDSDGEEITIVDVDEYAEEIILDQHAPDQSTTHLDNAIAHPTTESAAVDVEATSSIDKTNLEIASHPEIQAMDVSASDHSTSAVKEITSPVELMAEVDEEVNPEAVLSIQETTFEVSITLGMQTRKVSVSDRSTSEVEDIVSPVKSKVTANDERNLKVVSSIEQTNLETRSQPEMQALEVSASYHSTNAVKEITSPAESMEETDEKMNPDQSATEPAMSQNESKDHVATTGQTTNEDATTASQQTTYPVTGHREGLSAIAESQGETNGSTAPFSRMPATCTQNIEEPSHDNDTVDVAQSPFAGIDEHSKPTSQQSTSVTLHGEEVSIGKDDEPVEADESSKIEESLTLVEEAQSPMTREDSDGVGDRQNDFEQRVKPSLMVDTSIEGQSQDIKEHTYATEEESDSKEKFVIMTPSRMEVISEELADTSEMLMLDDKDDSVSDLGVDKSIFVIRTGNASDLKSPDDTLGKSVSFSRSQEEDEEKREVEAINDALAEGSISLNHQLPGVDPTLRIQVHNDLIAWESKRRSNLSLFMETAREEWKNARGVLRDGVEELQVAERLVLGFSKAGMLFADAINAMYEDKFLDNQGNTVTNSFMQNRLMNARRAQEYSIESSDGQGQTSGQSSLLNSVLESQEGIAKIFVESAKHVEAEVMVEASELRAEIQAKANELEALGDSILGEMKRSEMEVKKIWGKWYFWDSLLCGIIFLIR